MLFLETGRKVTEMGMSEGRFVESRKGWQEEPENCASWPQVLFKWERDGNGLD